MFANPVFITLGSFIVLVFLQRVDILVSFNYWLHEKYVYLKTLRRWSKGLAERIKGGGGGKMVILSTSTSTQIPNPKTSEKKQHKQTTQ